MKTNEEMYIKIIRLITGEDVIGMCYFDDENNTLLIQKPMKVYINRLNESSKTMLFIMPWLPLELIDENESNINYDDILTVINPNEQFIEYYLNTTELFDKIVNDKKENTDFSNFSDLYSNKENDLEEDDIEEFEEPIGIQTKQTIH